MKLLLRAALISLFLVSLCPGQKRGMTLAQATALLEDPDFEVSEVMKMLENLGPDFELSEANLSALLESAGKGHKPPRDVSHLVFTLIKACRTCRDQFWGPLSKDDLANLLRKGSAFTLDEVKERGLKDLPENADLLQELRAKGAKPELLAYIDGRVVVQPPVDFKTLPLAKGPTFNAEAAEGALTIHAEIDGQVEFQFRHNALFQKAMKGGALKDLGCSYTAFGPKAEERMVQWTVLQVVPKPGKAKKGKQPAVADSFLSDPSGRNGFRLLITNTEKKPAEYEIQVHWKILDSPKPPRGASTGA